MRIVLAAALASLVAGCATTTEYGWAPTEAGCVDESLFGALLEPGVADLRQTDLRIGRLPDTGNGHATMVEFRRGWGGLGEFVDPPRIVISAGSWAAPTCTIVVTEADCPPAAAIHERLSSQSLPVGFRFDDPAGLTLMHGTTYFLASVDGRGNLLRWEYYGAPAHPMQSEIDRALDALQACVAPAAAAYESTRKD